MVSMEQGERKGGKDKRLGLGREAPMHKILLLPSIRMASHHPPQNGKPSPSPEW